MLLSADHVIIFQNVDSFFGEACGLCDEFWGELETVTFFFAVSMMLLACPNLIHSLSSSIEVVTVQFTRTG